MTQTEIASALNIARSTLLRLRKDFKGAPSLDAPLEDWRAFVERNLIFDLERRKASNPHPHKGQADKMPSGGRQGGSGHDAGALRKERIIKLRLYNAQAREKLALIRRETLTVKEVKETLERIRMVTAEELYKMSEKVSVQLAGKGTSEIQQTLDAAIREVLEKLSHPESYEFTA